MSEQVVPLAARPWLGRLATVDPQAGALLTGNPEATIPPLSEWLFLDLETTGLAGGTGTYAFLVGIGQVALAGFRIRQFFLRDLAAEAALLTELAPVLRQARLLVTYNGKLFDLPLLDTRFRLARRPAPLDHLLHLDLLYPARRLWKARLGSARLVEVEKAALGFERPEDVPGELIPRLYFHYLRGGEERPLQAVFRHNAADLLSLAALAGRLLSLLAAPESSSGEPLELLGLARLHERALQRAPSGRAGHAARARALYEQALAGGLPEEMERAALLRLSLLCKRQRDYLSAAALWGRLVETSAPRADRETLLAYEQLAICHEHRWRDVPAAAELTRRALTTLERSLVPASEDRLRYQQAAARFTHRLARLSRKQTCFSSFIFLPAGSNSLPTSVSESLLERRSEPPSGFVPRLL